MRLILFFLFLSLSTKSLMAQDVQQSTVTYYATVLEYRPPYGKPEEIFSGMIKQKMVVSVIWDRLTNQIVIECNADIPFLVFKKILLNHGIVVADLPSEKIVLPNE